MKTEFWTLRQPCSIIFTDKKGEWQSGFFDKDSFNEILQPWAQTVVVGRARYLYTFTFSNIENYLDLSLTHNYSIFPSLTTTPSLPHSQLLHLYLTHNYSIFTSLTTTQSLDRKSVV